MAGRRRLPEIAFIVLGIALSLSLAGCSKSRSENEVVLERGCGSCHTTETPLAKKKSLEEWRKTVKAMRERGAKITDEEEKMLAEYLYELRPDKR